MLLLMIFVSIQCILSIQEGMQAICLSLSLLWTKDQRSEGYIWTPNPTCTSNSDGKSGMGTHWLAPSPSATRRSTQAAECHLCVSSHFATLAGLGQLGCHATLDPQLFTYWLPIFPWGFISHSTALLLLGHKVSLRLGTSLQWCLFGVTHWWVIACKSQLHSYS